MIYLFTYRKYKTFNIINFITKYDNIAFKLIVNITNTNFLLNEANKYNDNNNDEINNIYKQLVDFDDDNENDELFKL